MKIQYLVVDTTAFIRNVQLQELAENVYTVQEVVDEIKSNNQLKRLACIPYNLKIQQPFPESLKVVTEFAKKTGDYAVLSLTDLTVIALSYELEKQHVGTEHLKSEPIMPKTVFAKAKTNPDENASLPGFYLPKPMTAETERTESEEVAIDDELAAQIAALKCQEEEGAEEEGPDLDDSVLVKTDELSIEGEDSRPEDEQNESSDDEEQDADEGGWITNSNIKSLKYGFDCREYDDKIPIVACITTDFAMQNVLKQMNMNVVSLDGRVIKQTRTFILRCYACFKTTSDATKIFCPRCGNKTLKRVSVSLNDDGKQVIHINARKPLTTKYKNQTLPAPKGGKHACNPILFEDQPLPQQRISKKAQARTNALDEDYIAGYSPFVMRDVDSRSAMLRNTANIKQWMKNYEYDNHRRGYKKYSK